MFIEELIQMIDVYFKEISIHLFSLFLSNAGNF